MSLRELLGLVPREGWRQSTENANLSIGAESPRPAQRTKRVSTSGVSEQQRASGEELVPPLGMTKETEAPPDNDSDSPLSSAPSDLSDYDGGHFRPTKRRKTFVRNGSNPRRRKTPHRRKTAASSLPTPPTSAEDSLSPSENDSQSTDTSQLDGDIILVKPLKAQEPDRKRKSSTTRRRLSKVDSGFSATIRTGSGKHVKLVCNDCQRSDFRNAQGFINHCRQAHSVVYRTHDDAAAACGQPVDDDQIAAALALERSTPWDVGRPTLNGQDRTSPSKARIVQPEKAPNEGDTHESTSRKQSVVATLRVGTGFFMRLSRDERSGTQPDIESPTVLGPIFDPLLYTLSKNFALQHTNAEKPNPVDSPSVWADGRQALCETLPYFRAYQSGSYCSGGFAQGFMFDKDSHERDYIDSEVVLSHAGGGKARDKAADLMVIERDQTDNSVVQSVRYSMMQFNPVAIIIGDRNPNIRCRVPHAYCVLDWFKITHVWSEKSQGKIIIRYRFEKLHPEKQSWWAAQGQDAAVALGSLNAPESEKCSRCGKASMRVYLQSWICLRPECELFWKLKNGSEPQEADLLYDPRFLRQQTPWPHSSEPQPLRPALMTLSSSPTLGQNVSWQAWKGFVCPKCGRCSSREAWQGWVCGNISCGTTYSLPRVVIPADALHDFFRPLSSGFSFSRDIWQPLIGSHTEFQHNYRINIFEIPGIEGFVAHFVANKTVNEEAGGPDDMWRELQTEEVGLRRRVLSEGQKIRGIMLTQHFLVNYGMPYKFIAAVDSKSFDGACNAINGTRSRLNWAAKHLIKEHNQEFNEVLALGYFEKQAIDYHDDGEKGLGPTIATLSLGYPAMMYLRMKAKYYNGVSRTGKYVDRRPIPGCLKYEERVEAHEALQAIKDGEAYKEKVKALPKELGLDKKTTGNAKDVMSLHLGHGDIVIMHGTGIQEYYEHAVEPSGKLRFALTCRYIDPDSLRMEDKPTYNVAPDVGRYDGGALPAVPV